MGLRAAMMQAKRTKRSRWVPANVPRAGMGVGEAMVFSLKVRAGPAGDHSDGATGIVAASVREKQGKETMDFSTKGPLPTGRTLRTARRMNATARTTAP